MSKSDPKDYLRKMVDHTVAGDMDAAGADFNAYLIPKAKEVLGIDLSDVQKTPEPEATPDETVETETETNED